MSFSILCSLCKHYKFLNTCDAFLEGIPEKILLGEMGHDKPLSNQKNDIVFEKIEKK
ncbi:hypothetical protein LCGC14_0570330 [marine sediment metagenome]|uniref:Uncharacterized protein n=1 Tax=marine sediment metagenome TaxID=412755 RepID=A0A0F9U5N8_9ZZZZ|nr:cytoplasmic protein [Pricia sp.]